MVLPGAPLEYPVTALCRGDLAVLALSVHPLHMLQYFIDLMAVGVGQLIVLVPSLDGSWAAQLVSFSSSSLPSKILQHCFG